MLFGTKDGTRFGYVALEATFGSGIPICSSVSWFGAALLAGVNVNPDRTLAGDHGDDFNWYQHWYAPAPAPFSVMNARKWAPVDDGWAVGAGVTIGSSDGKAWSLRALLAVIAPGPVVIIEGRLRLLQTREPHSGPPRASTIRGLMVLDFEQGDFLLALEVEYKLPESGLLLDVHAAGEVFYGHRPGDWHLAIGLPEPISRRVRAKALRLLDWDCYFVISGSDLVLAERTFPGTALALGYRTGIDKRGKWGPVRGVLAVWIAGDVALSFNPRYILAAAVAARRGEHQGLRHRLRADARRAARARSAGRRRRPVLRRQGADQDRAAVAAARHQEGHSLQLGRRERAAAAGHADGGRRDRQPGLFSGGGAVLRARDRRRGRRRAAARRSRHRSRSSGRCARRGPGAPTPVDLAQPDLVGDIVLPLHARRGPCRRHATSGSPHDATEDLFGQWTLGHGDADGPQAESLVLWGLTPFPAAGNLAWPGRTERRSWVDLLFDTYATWPCGTLPPTERCINFELVPLGVYDPELRYRPDPAFGAVVFTPWPNAARQDDVDGQIGESVQVPLAIVNTIAQEA